MTLKLYAVSDGPPSLSVRQLLAELQVPYELVNVIYNNGEHMTAEYAKVIFINMPVQLFISLYSIHELSIVVFKKQ